MLRKNQIQIGLSKIVTLCTFICWLAALRHRIQATLGKRQNMPPCFFLWFSQWGFTAAVTAIRVASFQSQSPCANPGNSDRLIFESHTLCSTMWACSKANIPLTNIVFIWNPTAIRCPFLIVPDADPPTGICTSQALEYNTRCTFTCRNGYRLKGSKERVCQLDKSWSGSPTICERMYTRKHIPCHKNYSSQHTLNAAHHGKVGGIPSSLQRLSRTLIGMV